VDRYAQWVLCNSFLFCLYLFIQNVHTCLHYILFYILFTFTYVECTYLFVCYSFLYYQHPYLVYFRIQKEYNANRYVHSVWINISKIKRNYIIPIELEIKNTTNTDRSASYLDLHLKIDSECRLRTKLYNKRDDSNFHIVNFPHNFTLVTHPVISHV
jgi:hypothetical protein